MADQTDDMTDDGNTDSEQLFNVHGLDGDDDEARNVANQLYAALNDAGYDVDGVAPVLNEEVLN